MKLARITITAAVFVGILSWYGCTDSAPSGPTPGLGNNTVTKYVAIGNSLTAGYQSAGLYASAQVYSFPNLIAQQLVKAGANLGNFEQPLYSDPGTPDPVTGKASRYEIISFADPNNPVIGPKGLTAGAPSNSTLARPYDNLGIPGIPLAGFMDTTGTYQSAPLGRDAILRWTTNPLLGKSVFRQIAVLKAAGLTPDLVTFWLGANDVLGYATTGGVSPSAPTSSTIFGALYTQALDTLRAILPNAKIVVMNIPDVKAIPFFTTIGPKIKASIGAILSAGGYFYFQKAGSLSGGTPAVDSTRFTGTSDPLVTLKGGTYAPLLGTPTFTPYRSLLPNYATAQAMGIDSTKPFGLDRKNPFPDAYVLDASEQTAATTAITAFNSTISARATAKQALLVDINAFFNQIVAQGYSVSGEVYTAAYISGGLFSLDGVHPSSRGYAIVANEIIKKLNSGYGMSIPLYNVADAPGIPLPVSKAALGQSGFPTFSPGAWRSFEEIFGHLTY